LRLILNELITNALKHAFPEGQRGSVRVELRKLGAVAMLLAVGDDGVAASGLDLAKSKSLRHAARTTLVDSSKAARDHSRLGNEVSDHFPSGRSS